MAYEKPEVKEVSLNYDNEKEIRFGKDTQSGCSRSCCFAQGSDYSVDDGW